MFVCTKINLIVLLTENTNLIDSNAISICHKKLQLPILYSITFLKNPKKT